MLESPISAAALRVSTAASPYGSPLTDPLGSSILVASVHWLEGTLLGTTATTIAVICVASVGFMALTGRVDLRRAATVILGCFILFGASSIVAGLERMAREGNAIAPAPQQDCVGRCFAARAAATAPDRVRPVCQGFCPDALARGVNG